MPLVFTGYKVSKLIRNFVSSTNSVGPHRTYPHLVDPINAGSMETARRHQLVQNNITTLANTGTWGASEQEYKMCYKVECDKCGKFTWKGCGQHVKSVYDGIEKGKHCACKEWPGVDTKVEGSTSTTKEGEAKA